MAEPRDHGTHEFPDHEFPDHEFPDHEFPDHEALTTNGPR